jgi:uncharacterized alkaline shock family protein YloU
MPDERGPTYAAEVIESSVWQAIKDVEGLAALHRGPLNTLGERAHIERLQPVRLDRDGEEPVLDIHIVVAGGAHIPTVSRAVAVAGAAHLAAVTGTPVERVDVHVDDIAAAE